MLSRLFPWLFAEYQNVHFAIAGTPALVSDLNEANGLIKYLAIAGKVEMPGVVAGQEKSDLLVQSDILGLFQLTIRLKANRSSFWKRWLQDCRSLPVIKEPSGRLLLMA